MKKALTHIALHVKDVKASTQFYKDWCGMDVVHSREPGVTWLASPGNEDLFVIVLVPGGTSNAPQAANDFSHLGFAVDTQENLLAILQKAKEAGIICWDYQESPPPVGHFFCVRDPDGHMVEFSVGQPLGKDFKNKGAGKNRGPNL